MKPYELTVLVHPDLEMNTEPALEKVRKLIEENGGKIIKETFDGKKRMAYAIKGQEHALYYFFEVELPVSAPAKINSALGISDEVMRMLLVKVDERKVKIQMKKKERYEKAVAAGRVEEGEKKEESKEEKTTVEIVEEDKKE